MPSPARGTTPQPRGTSAAARKHSEDSMSMYEKSGGMTEEEAIRFNKYWIAGTGVWVLGAVMAHLLAWSWRPWF